MDQIGLELLLAGGIVGFLIGAVGIGGVLLIPALVAVSGLTPHQSSATALFTFMFTGVLSSFLFQRKGSIDWRPSKHKASYKMSWEKFATCMEEGARP